jgi:hypothetical protein
MQVDVAGQRSDRAGVAMDSYGEAVARLARKGAGVAHAEDYLVAVLQDRPKGRYEVGPADLTWREAAPYNTVRFDVAIADAQDGRFVPGLIVHLTAERNGRTLAAAQCPFRWHPTLHRYAADVRLPAGRYEVTVRIGPPSFPRDDRQAGHRYAEPAVLRFPDVVVQPGSPSA